MMIMHNQKIKDRKKSKELGKLQTKLLLQLIIQIIKQRMNNYNKIKKIYKPSLKVKKNNNHSNSSSIYHRLLNHNYNKINN